ncbi:MAG: Excalibur calcium-binding domain protein [Marmoricola sp.]|nr:Excalibur calcium-binding domain protein [Marmoricola sp.]
MLHTRHAHGIGRATAPDRTSGRPVTNFRHTRGYDVAVRKNRGLDRDRDGIACEAR